MNASLALVAATLTSCASTPPPADLYFPALAARVECHEPAALEAVLALSAKTPPGEQLEELAELAASYVRYAPAEFLRAQKTQPHCFGASFLGPNFLDNPQARAREVSARRQALSTVPDPDLEAVKARCLAELAGR